LQSSAFLLAASSQVLADFAHLFTAADLFMLHLVAAGTGLFIHQFSPTFFALVSITYFSGHG
jgi:hypothetical protein